MQNILIVGGGIGGQRYTEALLFDQDITLSLAGFGVLGKTAELALKYKLDYLEFFKMDSFSQYQCLIICIPPNSRIDVLNIVIDSGYLGKIIIDKPLSLNLEDCNLQLSMLKNIEFIVPYSRRFIYNINSSTAFFLEDNIIRIPIIDRSKMYLVNLVTHVLT